MAQEQTKIFAEIKKAIRKGIRKHKDQVNISAEIIIAKEKGYTENQITTYVGRNLESLKRHNKEVDYMTFDGQEVKIVYKVQKEEYDNTMPNWLWREINIADG